MYKSGGKAIRNADGRLVKKIYEPEDEKARLQAEAGDEGYTYSSGVGNKFVMLGDVAAASDGNVYLLHGGSFPLVYVISPAGDVVRKLRIDYRNNDDPRHIVQGSIKFYAGRLAVGFDRQIKIIDLLGNSIAAYEAGVDGFEERSSLSLACYGPEGLTLIGHAKTKLALSKVKLP